MDCLVKDSLRISSCTPLLPTHHVVLFYFFSLFRCAVRPYKFKCGTRAELSPDPQTRLDLSPDSLDCIP